MIREIEYYWETHSIKNLLKFKALIYSSSEYESGKMTKEKACATLQPPYFATNNNHNKR